MSAMASQITNPTIVYSTVFVYSGEFLRNSIPSTWLVGEYIDFQNLLNQYDLVPPYGDIKVGQHWLK